MKIQSVFDDAFKSYGQVLKGYDFEVLLKELESISPKPENEVIYKASEPELEALPIKDGIEKRGFGGMPIQIGFCNGTNSKLNCLEYHRNSEINIPADDVILLLAHQSDLNNFTLDTSKIEAFLVPAGTGVEIYATTLHYAPCSANAGQGYRVIVALLKGTNVGKTEGLLDDGEDRLCFGKNKWLIAHEDAPEVKDGAFVGLFGENIDLY